MVRSNGVLLFSVNTVNRYRFITVPTPESLILVINNIHLSSFKRKSLIRAYVKSKDPDWPS